MNGGDVLLWESLGKIQSLHKFGKSKHHGEMLPYLCGSDIITDVMLIKNRRLVEKHCMDD